MKERGAKEEELYAMFKAEMEEEEAEAREREARDAKRRKRALERQTSMDERVERTPEPAPAI